MEFGMGLKRVVTIRQAMQMVADRPEITTDDLISLPAHELVVRTLFEIANNANSTERGAASKANTARGMIFNRMVGRRRSGSHPATKKTLDIEFADLTGGEIGS